ncbi:MAG: RnfABCDGE type electron transport complex subunit B [Clostridia bacterium]|nr:RnfABCDGE type electron transport complex subunit B [Clostridia bacterium]
MSILYAGLVLGGIGFVFGLVLTFAAKAFCVEADERVDQIRECLAGANCGACGYPGCDGFAKAVVEGKASVNGCAPAGEAGAKKIAAIMGLEAEAVEAKVACVMCQGVNGEAKEKYKYDGYQSCLAAVGIAGGPKSCRFACLGLGDCVNKCKFGAISLKDGVAVIDPDKCTACGACVEACPRHVISLLPAKQQVTVRCHNTENAKAARAVCSNACIGCGRCKKECEYDAITVENGLAHIDPEKCTACGKCAGVCPCTCIVVK